LDEKNYMKNYSICYLLRIKNINNRKNVTFLRISKMLTYSKSWTKLTVMEKKIRVSNILSASILIYFPNNNHKI